MSIDDALHARSGSACELCGASENLAGFEVPPSPDASADTSVLLCATCRGQIENPATLESDHWRCLNDSMWSQTPAVQVMAWRLLKRLSAEAWAADLLDMLYLEDEVLAWAQDGVEDQADQTDLKHLDAHGAELSAGDTVTLIKDLAVKGAGFTAKRGTAVRGISLVPDNAAHIEGRVQGQQIVILTEFVKKST